MQYTPLDADILRIFHWYVKYKILDIWCGLPYVQIGGAHLKIIKQKWIRGCCSQEPLQNNIYKNTKTLQNNFPPKYPPTQNNFLRVDKKIFGSGSKNAPKQFQPPQNIS